MNSIACSGRRQILRLQQRIVYSRPVWLPSCQKSPQIRRTFHIGTRRLAEQDGKSISDVRESEFWKEYKESFDTPPRTFPVGKEIPSKFVGRRVTVAGFLGKRRDLSEKLSFVDIHMGNSKSGILQVLSVADGKSTNDETHNILKSIKPNSSVSVTGLLQKKRAKGEKTWKKNGPDERLLLAGGYENRLKSGSDDRMLPVGGYEIRLESVKCLNSFPEDIIVGEDTQFSAGARHLQIRFNHELTNRLLFRSDLSNFIRTQLKDFVEVETPILFKSTPEGAREFLVPTRRAGYSYALPQSPQQYKQVLMASGIHRYYQFARCFRDEDLRADRQPEFTQIDIEMMCDGGEVVMRKIEGLIQKIYKRFPENRPELDSSFLRMSYSDAMSNHGSDKPDLRIRDLIRRIDHIVPSDLAGMLTSLPDPIVEACRFRLKGDPKEVQKFVVDFMESPEAEPFLNNPDGAPGVFVLDSRKPIGGLQAFGFQRAEDLKVLLSQNSASDADGAWEDGDTDGALEDGDLLIIQARKDLPHTGGSTALGRLRIALYKEAVARGLLSPDPKHHYLWVTNFPLFTLDNASDPGQGGASGFSATHHPFTAPKSAADVDLLLTEPLEVMADHYDLVVNGIELGGGSRRIHNAEMQKFVMREILKMSEERMNDFSHLFEALRSGCPPHAGFAIGFDRLVAVMTGVDSVRDVIAFPKSSKGEDLMVKSPSLMTDAQMETYHLKVTE